MKAVYQPALHEQVASSPAQTPLMQLHDAAVGTLAASRQRPLPVRPSSQSVHPEEQAAQDVPK